MNGITTDNPTTEYLWWHNADAKTRVRALSRSSFDAIAALGCATHIGAFPPGPTGAAPKAQLVLASGRPKRRWNRNNSPRVATSLSRPEGGWGEA